MSKLQKIERLARGCALWAWTHGGQEKDCEGKPLMPLEPQAGDYDELFKRFKGAGVFMEAFKVAYAVKALELIDSE